MNAQDVFNISATHLLKQGVKSINAAGTCLYRGPNGTMCAAGPFIKDSEVERCESDNIYSIPRDALIEGASEHLDLLGSLQGIHDIRDPVEWRGQLERLARTCLLTMPVVEGAVL